MALVRNLDTGNIVVQQLEVASTHWSRFRGLMMRGSLAPGEGLLIEPCSSIHMMWMRFGIDAIWLDDDWQVTRVSRGVRPWVGLARGGRGAKRVIELASSAAAGVEAGHRLEVQS